jgi:hypothetical protein
VATRLGGSLLRHDERLGEVVPGSIALGGAVAIQALGGLAFWLLAAHLHATERIGEGSALFQSVLFLNYVASLGLPVALARFGGLGKPSVTLMRLGVSARTASAVVSAGLFLVLTSASGIGDPLWSSGVMLGSLIYVGLTVGMALAVLVEVRLITLRRWGWVLARAAVPALLRLPLLALAAAATDEVNGMTLFVLAAGPMALSGFVGVVALRFGIDGATAPLTAATRAAFVRCAAVGWLNTIATEGPIFAVPLIVALTVGSAENAAFYVAWSFGALAFVLPQMVAQVTVSEAAQGGAAEAQLLGGLKLALGITMVAAVLAQFGAGLVASAYGPGYELVADQLPLLVAASICWCYTAIGIASARLAGRDHDIALLSAVFLIGTVGPTVLLVGRSGSAAATWAWLLGNASAALTAFAVHLRRRRTIGPGLVVGVVEG